MGLDFNDILTGKRSRGSHINEQRFIQALLAGDIGSVCFFGGKKEIDEMYSVCAYGGEKLSGPQADDSTGHGQCFGPTKPYDTDSPFPSRSGNGADRILESSAHRLAMSLIGGLHHD
jgi:hypothetical protein